uniref:Glycosyltransferase n=1 Tax=viral metagenome TaxID=1070528 RepID=A0A6M3J4T1_9ZZZZ
MTWPPPWPDEGWFADIALHGGRTALFGTHLGLDQVTGWMPPLYWATLRVWFGLVGTGLWQQRALSVVCALLATWALWRLAVRWGPPGWTALLVWCLPSWWRSTLMGRPDMMCLALMLWCYALTGWRSGLAGGLALCVHPMAAPVLLRGLWSSRWRTWCLAAAVPLGIWGVYVLVTGPDLWYHQWAAQMGRKWVGGNLPPWARLAWMDPIVMGMAVLGLAYAPARRWLLLGLLGAVTVYLGGERWYPVYLVPVAVLGLGRAVWGHPWRRWLLTGWAVLSLLMVWRVLRTESVEIPDHYREMWLPSYIKGGTVPDPYWYVPDTELLRYEPPI